MKASILNRIKQLENKISRKNKPCLFLRDGEPEPENPDSFNIIQFRTIDLSNYLEPGSPRRPYCPI